MTDQSAQEPTMEEILASIRRIISEDEAPAETAQAADAPAVEASAVEEVFPAAAPEPEPAPVEAAFEPVAETEAPAAADDDVLELTERYEAPTESIGDLDVSSAAAEPADQPKPEPEAPAVTQPVTDHAPPPADELVSAASAASAASAFAGLSASLRMPSEARSLEDLVKEMMRPMLKEWLDANLPGIVEAQVRSEVERIARQAR